MREQRQHLHHFSALANRTEAAIGFTSTMIPKQNHAQTVPFGTIFPSAGEHLQYALSIYIVNPPCPPILSRRPINISCHSQHIHVPSH